jgi:hypothetical protein
MRLVSSGPDYGKVLHCLFPCSQPGVVVKHHYQRNYRNTNQVRLISAKEDHYQPDDSHCFGQGGPDYCHREQMFEHSGYAVPIRYILQPEPEKKHAPQGYRGQRKRSRRAVERQSQIRCYRRAGSSKQEKAQPHVTYDAAGKRKYHQGSSAMLRSDPLFEGLARFALRLVGH